VRRSLIAGNWKMNLNKQESIALAKAVCKVEESLADILICPPYVYLDAVSSVCAGTPVSMGAQDAYFESNGAFTGEISVDMLKDLGCEFVILGHSERRHLMGESDQLVNKKIHTVLAAGLTPILCVGETLAEREKGKTLEVVQSQFSGSTAGLADEQMRKTVVAYEPVWAIGTGKTATPGQAQEVHADLRKIIARGYNPETADVVRILYGGSVKPGNAAELLTQPDIDGALVGGASLEADSFTEIIKAASVGAT
jgi:triosephosphate isomerase